MKQNAVMVILVLLTFFAISFLTNILGAINPNAQNDFNLSLTLVGFLPFSIFLAYGVMSIPAGVLVEKYTEKPVMIGAFILAFLAALMFAVFPKFQVFLISLFTIGLGFAMLQVIINPLLRTSGGEANFAFYSAMAQLVFGLASFLSPQLYSYLMQNVHSGDSTGLAKILENLVPLNLKWVSLYWVFSVVTLAMIFFIWTLKFPKVELTDEERIEVGSTLTGMLRNKTVILFFLGLFAYVGTEQGISYWISKFLQTYHGVDPETQGADAISLFWGLMTVGCLLGLFLLKIFDSKKVLFVCAVSTMVVLLSGLLGSKSVAVVAFPLCGFTISVMYPIIFSLGLNSVPKHHGTFAGIMCTGIVGGAVVPFVIGGIAQMTGLRIAMFFVFITLGYILSISIWAKPIISNATISIFKKKARFEV
ncbi:MAG TPA: MFS transporter [Bacteroidales bacterium]|jgi:fucose permease|nr:MFS transporter [Bacteroidales bacterium]